MTTTQKDLIAELEAELAARPRRNTPRYKIGDKLSGPDATTWRLYCGVVTHVDLAIPTEPLYTIRTVDANGRKGRAHIIAPGHELPWIDA